MNAYEPIRLLKHYIGKVRTMRNEIRSDRLLNALPASIRKDIGWPDNHASRRANRG